MTPSIIEKLNKGLIELLEADDSPIVTVEEVAKYLDIDKAKLRQIIYSGKCPFAIGMDGGKYGHGYSRINKLAFYNWIRGNSNAGL